MFIGFWTLNLDFGILDPISEFASSGHHKLAVKIQAISSKYRIAIYFELFIVQNTILRTTEVEGSNDCL